MRAHDAFFLTTSDISFRICTVPHHIMNTPVRKVFLRYPLALPVAACPCTSWMASKMKSSATGDRAGHHLMTRTSRPRIRASTHTLRDGATVDELIMPHIMILLHVKTRTHAVSLRAQATAMSTFPSTFLHFSDCRCELSHRHLDKQRWKTCIMSTYLEIFPLNRWDWAQVAFPDHSLINQHLHTTGESQDLARMFLIGLTLHPK